MRPSGLVLCYSSSRVLKRVLVFRASSDDVFMLVHVHMQLKNQQGLVFMGAFSDRILMLFHIDNFL